MFFQVMMSGGLEADQVPFLGMLVSRNALKETGCDSRVNRSPVDSETRIRFP